MLAESWKMCGWMGVAGACVSLFGTPALGARYADVLGYHEPGQNVDVVYGSDPIELYDNALAALGGPGLEVALSQGTLTEIVSLGGWTDDAASGTNNRTPGLVVGFSAEVINGPGDDLLVVGNAPSDFVFYEPGYVEVAIESDGGGAKPNGWQDETFYLIKPGNYDLITDPRTALTDIGITTNPDYSLNYSPPFDGDSNLPGYFDITHGGDHFDIADAIDIAGNPVTLNGVAYVRLRSVSDSAFPFGSYFAPEVDYLEAIEVVGDFDGDGFVGIADLNLVLSTWNQSVPSGATGLGDASGDGFVGIDDLNIVLGNWNTGTPPAPAGLTNVIPEPTAISMMLLTGAVPLLRRGA
jgi:hypothetical protein